MIHILMTDQSVKAINSDTHDSYEGVKVELKNSGVVIFLSDDIVKKIASYKEDCGFYVTNIHAKRKLKDLIMLDESESGILTGAEKSFLIGLKHSVIKKDLDLSPSQKGQVANLWDRYQGMIEKVEQSKKDGIPF